jgi:hypothetical protein
MSRTRYGDAATAESGAAWDSQLDFGNDGYRHDVL